MRKGVALILATVLALGMQVAGAGPALADDDDYDDDYEHRRHGYYHAEHRGHHRGGYEKYEYRDGHCKVEIKRGPHGYKEERKCRYDRRHGYRGQGHPHHGYDRDYSHYSKRHHGREQRYAPVWTDTAPLYGGGGGALTCRRELVGQIVGGAVGALAGSNIGKGSGQLYAVAGGALIGVLVGGELGRHMDRVDQGCVNQALEHVPSGRSVVWANPEAGAHYETTPQRTYQTDAGRYCREYITTATVAGRAQQVYGTACRQPDGSWELVD